MTWSNPPEHLTQIESLIKDYDLSPTQERELKAINIKWGHEVIDFCSRERIVGPRSLFVIFNLAELSARLIAGFIAANTKKRFAQHLIETTSKTYSQSLTIHEHEAREVLKGHGHNSGHSHNSEDQP